MLKRRLLILSFLPHFCFAMSIADFFYNPNQQGYNLLKQKKNALAAAKFTDKNWKGVAYYRDKQYEAAYDEFKLDNSAEGLYNQGNALANLEKYDEAISAYTKALELKKDYPEARFNKELLEKLKQQQQDPDKSDNQKDKSDKKSDKSDDKQDKNNQSDNKSDKNNKSDKPDKSDTKNSKDKSQNAKNGSNDNKNSSEQAKAKPQEKQLDKNAKEDTKTEQQTAKPDNSAHQTPTQIENAEVKSALSQVPDDPGGLLRNKFLRDYQSGQDND